MKRCRPLLGTYVEISISDSGCREFDEKVINEAFDEIELVQELMSFHDPASDLSKINSLAVKGPVQVHPWTYEVLSFAKEICAESFGAFNCAIAPELQSWGKLPVFEIDNDQYVSNLYSLRLLDGNFVSFDQPLKIDLGGIAKGFAVDVALDVLRDYDIKAGVINAGGDLGVIGRNSHPIYLRDSSNPEKVHFLGELCEGALATSGVYYSRSIGNPVHSAIVIPGEGDSVIDEMNFSVIASSCMTADALTKPLAIHQDIHASYFEKYQAIGLIN